jgi:transposase
MPAKYVRPYSKGQKNGFRDAGGDRRGRSAPDDEVCGNEDCRTARPAGDASRARAIGQPAHWHGRYARQAGLRFLRAELPRILATPPDVLSARTVQVISDLAEDWRHLDHRIDHLSNEITLLAVRTLDASG